MPKKKNCQRKKLKLFKNCKKNKTAIIHNDMIVCVENSSKSIDKRLLETKLIGKNESYFYEPMVYNLNTNF